jgi:hypothetical protein
MSVESHIRLWIKHLSTPQKDLNQMAVCPYAAKARYKIIDRVKKPIQFDKDKKLLEKLDVLIYLKEFRLKKKEMYALCDQLNDQHKEYIFLPDHWDEETQIKDVRTNNGLYNLILCQKRSKLENARKFLKSKKYYSYWNKKYLKEVLSI